MEGKSCRRTFLREMIGCQSESCSSFDSFLDFGLTIETCSQGRRRTSGDATAEWGVE